VDANEAKVENEREDGGEHRGWGEGRGSGEEEWRPKGSRGSAKHYQGFPALTSMIRPVCWASCEVSPPTMCIDSGATAPGECHSTKGVSFPGDGAINRQQHISSEVGEGAEPQRKEGECVRVSYDDPRTAIDACISPYWVTVTRRSGISFLILISLSSQGPTPFKRTVHACGMWLSFKPLSFITAILFLCSSSSWTPQRSRLFVPFSCPQVGFQISRQTLDCQVQAHGTWGLSRVG